MDFRKIRGSGIQSNEKMLGLLGHCAEDWRFLLAEII